MENQVEHPVSESQVEGIGEHPEADAPVPSDPNAAGLTVEDVEVPVDFDALELEPESESTSEATAGLRLEVESLKQDLEDLKGQLDERNGQYVRIAADFENFRNRTQREKGEQEQRVKCTTILELLPVVDNFERARAQLKPEGEEAKQIHNSYQGIYKQLVEALKRLGVAPMRAEGKEFDPMLHEAMMRQPTDQYPEGTVMEEFQRGYLLGDRVLRHAMVKVAAAQEPVIPSEENHNNPIPES